MVTYRRCRHIDMNICASLQYHANVVFGELASICASTRGEFATIQNNMRIWFSSSSPQCTSTRGEFATIMSSPGELRLANHCVTRFVYCVAKLSTLWLEHHTHLFSAIKHEGPSYFILGVGTRLGQSNTTADNESSTDLTDTK